MPWDWTWYGLKYTDITFNLSHQIKPKLTNNYYWEITLIIGAFGNENFNV